MTATALLEEARRRGVEIVADGDRLRYRPKGALTDAEGEALREHKAELLALLADWPPECLESERRFGFYAARLYPLLRHTVQTPRGTGLLLQVFVSRVAVALDGTPQTATFFRPEEVRP